MSRAPQNQPDDPALEHAIGLCDNCGQPADTLYEVRGYAGFYRFCPACFHDDDEPSPRHGNTT